MAAHTAAAAMGPALLSTLMLLPPPVAAASGTAGRPHILYIVADDFGWADAEWHPGPGDSRPATPQIAALSAAGVRLESFYTQPICSATRSSILTGRYVQRLGFQHHNPPVALGGVGAVPLGEKLLPEYMRDAGYAAYHVGKWHQGMAKDAYLPHNRGFESSFGYYEGAVDYYNHTVGGKAYAWAHGVLDLHSGAEGGQPTCHPEFKGTYDLDLFAGRAKEVMSRHNASRPFFMYLALHSVHDPDECPQKWYDMYEGTTGTDNRRTMCGMVSAMDAAVGDVVAHFHATLGDNVVVLFHSDNGGPTYADAGALNYPLRGGKLTLFDGGMRVVAFAWSPHIARPGRVEHGLVHITDILPTFAEGLGGSKPLGGKRLDGHNVWATISEGAASPRREILHLVDPLGNAEFLDPMGCNISGKRGACQLSAAFRADEWKLIVGMFAACSSMPNKTSASERLCGWHRYIDGEAGAVGEPADPSHGLGAAGAPALPSDPSPNASLPVALFNIAADPEERHDVSRQHPALVQRLLSRIRHYHLSSEWLDPQWPPFLTCDTPDGSCTPQPETYRASVARRGCNGPFLDGHEAALVV